MNIISDSLTLISKWIWVSSLQGYYYFRKYHILNNKSYQFASCSQVFDSGDKKPLSNNKQLSSSGSQRKSDQSIKLYKIDRKGQGFRVYYL